MRTGGSKQAYFRETVLALVVLALACLSYGHVAVSASVGLRVTPDSWCGDLPAPGSPDHTPCHACRIGSAADVPPPSDCIEPAAFVAMPVAYSAPPAAPELRAQARRAQPRGPPPFV